MEGSQFGGWPRRCFERLGCEATRGLAIGNVGHESRDVSAVKPENIVSEDRLLEFFELRTHRGRTPAATASTCHRHPTCGDEIELSLAIEAGTLQSIRFEARGCVVSQAAAAMLCEHLEGKPLAEVNAFTPRDMLALVGLPLSPRRLGCASSPTKPSASSYHSRPYLPCPRPPPQRSDGPSHFPSPSGPSLPVRLQANAWGANGTTDL